VFTECPNCFTNVLMTASRVCPACGVRAAEMASSQWTKVTFRNAQRVPRYCLRCGTETERTKLVRRTRKRKGDSIFVKLVVWVFAWTSAGALTRTEKTEVAVTVPICEGCAAEGPLEPHSVDYESFTMAFVAHREFARRLRQGAV